MTKIVPKGLSDGSMLVWSWWIQSKHRKIASSAGHFGTSPYKSVRPSTVFKTFSLFISLEKRGFEISLLNIMRGSKSCVTLFHEHKTWLESGVRLFPNPFSFLDSYKVCVSNTVFCWLEREVLTCYTDWLRWWTKQPTQFQSRERDRKTPLPWHFKQYLLQSLLQGGIVQWKR